MAVDVSLCGDRTTLDAFEVSRRPVLITHDDREIELILGGNFKRVLAGIWKRRPAPMGTLPK